MDKGPGLQSWRRAIAITVCLKIILATSPYQFLLLLSSLESVLKFRRISRTLHLLFCLFSFLSESSFLLVSLFSIEPKIWILPILEINFTWKNWWVSWLKKSHSCSFYTMCTFAWINNFKKGHKSVVFLKFLLPVMSENTELRKSASKTSESKREREEWRWRI